MQEKGTKRKKKFALLRPRLRVSYAALDGRKRSVPYRKKVAAGPCVQGSSQRIEGPTRGLWVHVSGSWPGPVVGFSRGADDAPQCLKKTPAGGGYCPRNEAVRVDR